MYTPLRRIAKHLTRLGLFLCVCICNTWAKFHVRPDVNFLYITYVRAKILKIGKSLWPTLMHKCANPKRK